MANTNIGVYTICKNESKFVRRWIESMWNNGKGAKKAFILDTGSTDDTVAEFRKVIKEMNIPYDWLCIDTKKYDFFRFDVARNDNLDMIKPYENEFGALISVDLDEILLPEFWEDCGKIIEAHPNFEKIYYMYAWNHDDNGNPKRVFWYDKVHPVKNCRWVGAVHEVLSVEDPSRSKIYYMNKDIIYLHHYADDKKARSNYLPLLEIRAKENPDDIPGLYYLMREYLFKNPHNIKALAVGMPTYTRIMNDKTLFTNHIEVLPFIIIGIADVFAGWNLDEDAKFYYEKALEIAPNLRQPYISYGMFAAYRGDHNTALYLMDTMDRKAPTKYPTWYECDYNWTWRPYQIKAVAKCWRGEYAEAYFLFKYAVDKYMVTETDIIEGRILGLYDDFKWLLDYMKENDLHFEGDEQDYA